MSKMLKRFGVDISSANGKVDFAALKAAGVEFVLIRCGYGNDDASQDDGQFFENVRKARPCLKNKYCTNCGLVRK